MALGQEQWDACSGYPSVELMQITPDGQVLVRDKHQFGPPLKFQRCMAKVAFQQVVDGRRSPKHLLRRAYFSDRPVTAKNGFVTGGYGPARRTDSTFGPDEEVYFILVMETMLQRMEFTFTLSDEQGKLISYLRRVGPNRENSVGMYITQKLDLPPDEYGRFTVFVDVDGRDVGQFSLTVAKPGV